MFKKYWSHSVRKALQPSTKASSPSRRSWYLISLTPRLTVFNRALAPSTASMPSVRSSPESKAPVLISLIPVSSSSVPLSLYAYRRGQKVAGSALVSFKLCDCYISGFGATVHLGLLSNYFYLRVSYFSTAFTSTWPLLIVS